MRLFDLIARHGIGVGETGGVRFDHRNVGVTAHWTDHAFHALRAGKSRIEKWHTLDPSIGYTEIARAQVDAIEGEWFKKRLDAQSSNLRREPLPGLSVNGGSRSVVSLRVVRGNRTRHALFDI